MPLNYVFQVITVLAGILSSWLLNRVSTLNKTITDLRTDVHSADTDIAVLKSQLTGVAEDFRSLNNRLDGVDQKLSQLISLKPLLEDAILSVRELRQIQLRP